MKKRMKTIMFRMTPYMEKMRKNITLRNLRMKMKIQKWSNKGKTRTRTP